VVEDEWLKMGSMPCHQYGAIRSLTQEQALPGPKGRDLGRFCRKEFSGQLKCGVSGGAILTFLAHIDHVWRDTCLIGAI